MSATRPVPVWDGTRWDRTQATLLVLGIAVVGSIPSTIVVVLLHLAVQ